MISSVGGFVSYNCTGVTTPSGPGCQARCNAGYGNGANGTSIFTCAVNGNWIGSLTCSGCVVLPAFVLIRSACTSGTSDVFGVGQCNTCSNGTYTAPQSIGQCSPCDIGLVSVFFYAPHSPRFADTDFDPSTPCVMCDGNTTYQSSSGQTVCFNVTDCGIGQQQVWTYL